MFITKTELLISDKLDSIYYADLFKIKDQIWMITGAGKSKAARLASNYNKDADLARDAVAMLRDNNTLYGRWDAGAFNPTKDIDPWYKLDFIAHCLTEEETQKFYSNKPAIIEEINNSLLATFLAGYIHIYPIFMARNLISIEKYMWLRDPQKRINRFLELTNKIIITRFMMVPWMNSIEEKALLYTSL